MREIIANIKNSFELFNGTGHYMELFFCSLLFLFVKEDSKINRTLICFSVTMLTILLLPFSVNNLLTFVVKGNSYPEWFQLVPITVMIAYAGTKVFDFIKTQKERMLIAIIFLMIIAFTGNSLFFDNNKRQSENLYKVSNEIKNIGDMLVATDINPIVLAPEYIMSNLRKYQALVKFPYNVRNVSADSLEISKASIQDVAIVNQQINSSDPNFDYIIDYANRIGCNFIIFNIDINGEGIMESYGFKNILNTESFQLYARE